MSARDELPPGIGSLQGGDGAAGEVALLSFAALWFGALGFFVWVDPNSLCMVVPFGAIGLLPLMLGLKVRRNRLRYSSARLELTGDVIPGGRLEGVVHIAHAIEPDSHIRATLTCKRRVFGTDSVDAVVSRTVTFVEPPASEGATGRIPIQLELPAGAEASAADADADGSIYWRLNVEAERGCRGLDVSFYVPVARSDR